MTTVIYELKLLYNYLQYIDLQTYKLANDDKTLLLLV